MPPSDTAPQPAAPEPTVLVRRQGRIGRLTLNRPRALNALDLSMVRAIAAALQAWADEPEVQAVVLDAAGGRAFCAGGDIRAIRDQAIAGDAAAIEQFFVEEYAVNLAIARYPKPYISLIDGICMGGGIGLSAHGGVRVAGPQAQFAMPETAIGLFPDVGATFVLPRLRGAYGMYLALTGARIGAQDAAWLGLATHLVPSLDGLADALAQDGPAALATAVQPVTAAPLHGTDATPFGAASVPAILAGLERAGTEWAQTALAALRAASPTSLLWTFEIVQAGAHRTLEQCQQAELELTRIATRHPDFIEGVRAMVVDKDRAPRWNPPTLEAAGA